LSYTKTVFLAEGVAVACGWRGGTEQKKVQEDVLLLGGGAAAGVGVHGVCGVCLHGKIFGQDVMIKGQAYNFFGTLIAQKTGNEQDLFDARQRREKLDKDVNIMLNYVGHKVVILPQNRFYLYNRGNHAFLVDRKCVYVRSGPHCLHSFFLISAKKRSNEWRIFLCIRHSPRL
jgi:hypothetical protein